jgi:hypothetical protein
MITSTVIVRSFSSRIRLICETKSSVEDRASGWSEPSFSLITISRLNLRFATSLPGSDETSFARWLFGKFVFFPEMQFLAVATPVTLLLAGRITSTLVDLKTSTPG